MEDNTETVTITKIANGYQLTVIHDQTGSSNGCVLSEAAYELLRLHFVSDSFSIDKLKEAFTDGYFNDSWYDFDAENYR